MSEQRWNTAAGVAVVAFVVVVLVAMDLRPALMGVPSQSVYALPKLLVTLGFAALALWYLVAVRAWRGLFVSGEGSTAVRPHLRWGIVAALVGLAAVPLLATVTPTRFTWLGFAGRYDGALMWVASLVLMVAAARAAFVSTQLVRRAVVGFVVVASAVVAAAVTMGQAGITWDDLGFGALTASRLASTVGHPALVSAVAALAALMAVALVQSSVRLGLGSGAVLVLLAAATWTAFGVAYVGGRAALVALVVALAAFSLARLFAARSAPERWLVVAAVGAVIAGLVAGFAVSAVGASKLQRLTDTVTGTAVDRSVAERILFLRSGVRAIAAQPLVPYGPGAFTLLVWSHATPEVERALIAFVVPASVADAAERPFENLLRYPDPDTGAVRETRVGHDKVHNYVLDAWIAYGFVPTIAVLVVVLGIMVRVGRAGRPYGGAILAAACGYAVFVQAWFPTVALDPVMFALVGVAWGDAEAALSDGDGQVRARESRAARRLKQSRS